MGSSNELTRRTLANLAQFVVVMAAILFVSAWTLAWWQGWLFLVVFCGSLVAITVYFLYEDPELVRRRQHAGATAEKEREQKVVQAFASILIVLVLALPGLDHRFGWSETPPAVAIIGEVVLFAGLVIIFLVFRENTFAASTITVESGQRVISSGPYGYVRHPMYAGAIVMIVGIPLALGSLIALVASIALAGVIIWRLIAEERYLVRNLPGYSAYLQRVRYRLVPGIY